MITMRVNRFTAVMKRSMAAMTKKQVKLISMKLSKYLLMSMLMLMLLYMPVPLPPPLVTWTSIDQWAMSTM